MTRIRTSIGAATCSGASCATSIARCDEARRAGGGSALRPRAAFSHHRPTAADAVGACAEAQGRDRRANIESSADLFEALLTEIAEAIGRVANRTARTARRASRIACCRPKSATSAALLLALRREVARYARLAASLRSVVGRLDQAPLRRCPRIAAA